MNQTASAPSPVLVSPPEPRRDDNWIATFTGRRFWPLNPNPADVVIEDIAHALSNICRYGGHASPNYNVADHCILVSRWVKPEYALEGLLHDAPEAYGIGDMCRPVKHQKEMASYRAAEDRLWLVIAQVFGLPAIISAEVDRVDKGLVPSEKRAVLHDAFTGARPHGAKAVLFPDIVIEPMGHEAAEVAFLARYEELTRDNR